MRQYLEGLEKQITLKYPLFFLVVLIAIALVGAWWGSRAYKALQEKLATSEELLAYTTETYQEKVAALEGKLDDTEKRNFLLLETLQAEQAKIGYFEHQIRTIEQGIGVIEKLASTDPELLQKYSKVFFLNEHYAPSGLLPVETIYVVNPEKSPTIHSKVKPFLDQMLKAAEADTIDLKIVSAYRSFTEQTNLKSAYTVQYGTGANRFSADQGYSEHQLGTTLDFSSAENNHGLSGFDKTKAYAWLSAHAHEYGFALSYPPNNAYYIYEPWHWRFVGRELAARLKQEGKYFYDLDQREIDRYIVNLFD